MADTKISALTAGSPAQATDKLPAARASSNVSLTVANLDTYVAGASVATHAAVTTGVHGITAAGAALVDDATAADQRTTLGLGTSATLNVPAAGDAAAGEVVKGSDTRLTDARTPSAHAASHAAAGSDPVTLTLAQISDAGTAAAAATGDFEAAGAVSTHAALTTGVHGLGTASQLNVPATGDAASTEVVKGSDSRLTDSRAPTSHASSHDTGGGDAITALSGSVITSGTVGAAYLGTMTGDSGAGGAKGAVPAPAAGDAAAGKYLKADGTWTAPPSGTGDVVGPASATDNAIARFDTTTGKLIQNSGASVLDSGAVVTYGGTSKTDLGVYVGVTGNGAGAWGTSGDITFTTASSNRLALRSFGMRIAGNVYFNATGDATGSTAAGIVVDATDVVRIESSGGSAGKLKFARLVEANTAVAASPNVITANESGTSYNNTGATALNCHTLPTAAAGLVYRFRVTDADGIKVSCTGTETIRYAATVSAAAGYVQSTTVGDCFTLEAIDTTGWYVVEAVGAGIAVT